MSVMEIIAVNMAARTCSEDIAAAAHRVTCNITNGTSAWMRMSAPASPPAALPPAITHWEASNASAPLASISTPLSLAARMLMSVQAVVEIRAAMAAPILMAVTCADVQEDISEPAKGTVCPAWDSVKVVTSQLQ